MYKESFYDCVINRFICGVGTERGRQGGILCESDTGVLGLLNIPELERNSLSHSLGFSGRKVKGLLKTGNQAHLVRKHQEAAELWGAGEALWGHLGLSR